MGHLHVTSFYYCFQNQSGAKRRLCRNRGSQNFSTTQSCFPSSNWFFECEHSFIDKPMVTKEAAVPIRCGFETVSYQHVAHAQQRFNSIHTESFSSKSKSSRWKKGSAGIVPVTHLKRFFSVQLVQIHPVMPLSAHRPAHWSGLCTSSGHYPEVLKTTQKYI